MNTRERQVLPSKLRIVPIYDSKKNEPKYNLKFTFDFDENEKNIIRDFIDPDIKLPVYEFDEKDEFFKMDIDKDNFYKIFDQDLTDDTNHIKEYYENNCTEFKEDFQNMLLNINQKKQQKKPKRNNDNDYIIYDTSKQKFYKKKVGKNSNNPNKVSKNNLDFNKNRANDPNSHKDSPKIELTTFSRLNIHLIDDYII